MPTVWHPLAAVLRPGACGRSRTITTIQIRTAGTRHIRRVWERAVHLSGRVQRSCSLEDRASFYGADGRLRVAEYRWTQKKSNPDPEGWPWQLAVDEYRYDALVGASSPGRGANVTGTSSAPATTSTRATGVAYADCLGRGPRAVRDSAARQPGDLSGGHGRHDGKRHARHSDGRGRLPGVLRSRAPIGSIAYTYGPAVDQPLSAIRIDYVDTLFNQPARVLGSDHVVPHWNWRGRAEYGTMADGGGAVCQSGGTRCTSPRGGFSRSRSRSSGGYGERVVRDAAA